MQASGDRPTGNNLDHLAISPSGFVFNPTTGSTFTVNTTGRALLEGLRDGMTLDQLVTALGEQFSVGAADLKRDVLEYVRVLQDHTLLPRTFELE